MVLQKGGGGWPPAAVSDIETRAARVLFLRNPELRLNRKSQFSTPASPPWALGQRLPRPKPSPGGALEVRSSWQWLGNQALGQAGHLCLSQEDKALIPPGCPPSPQCWARDSSSTLDPVAQGAHSQGLGTLASRTLRRNSVCSFPGSNPTQRLLSVPLAPKALVS